VGDFQLLLQGKGYARALLTVPQGGIKDSNMPHKTSAIR